MSFARRAINRYLDWRALKRAETRYKMHLELKREFPSHTYPRKSEDLATMRDYGRDR